MTHPTPTAHEPSASPPPRGEGPGVGGRLPENPRPGLEPGPRPAARATPGVPVQARDGVLALALTLLLATQATAQIIPTGAPAADILLTQAIVEHRVFLTCSALDPATHTQILTNWERDVTSAVATLTANAVPPDAIIAFTDAAKPENLLLAPDTPFADVRQLCDAHPDWQTGYALLNITILELKLPQAFP